MFDDEFIESLPEDRLLAAYALCKKFIEVDKSIPEESELANYEIYIEALSALDAFSDVSGLSLPFELPKLDSEKKITTGIIQLYFHNTEKFFSEEVNKLTYVSSRERFKMKFGGAFIYEFSDGDLKKIQNLVNELREHIAKSEIFDAKHKERLMKKLESLQKEIHKKVTNLDKFWGLIGEAGVVLGKFGKDAKPLVDRIREIAQIVWQTQARAEELPSNTPLTLLSDGEDSD